MACSSIAVLMSGSHRNTWVALISVSPDDCALPCNKKHSICKMISLAASCIRQSGSVLLGLS